MLCIQREHFWAYTLSLWRSLPLKHSCSKNQYLGRLNDLLLLYPQINSLPRLTIPWNLSLEWTFHWKTHPTVPTHKHSYHKTLLNFQTGITTQLGRKKNYQVHLLLLTSKKQSPHQGAKTLKFTLMGWTQSIAWFRSLKYSIYSFWSDFYTT